MKIKTTMIYRFFGSKIFFQICAFLVLVGSAWFIYFTFLDRITSQDQILAQLVKNNNQVTELRDEVIKLKENICILQNQIESLGAIPAVEKDSTCQALLSKAIGDI